MTEQATTNDPASPDRLTASDGARFFSRELSWLEFNDRVLREGLSDHVPLLDRLKFLAIVSSNLDEFFMVRVAGLMQQRSAGIRRRDPAGFTPDDQLTHIGRRVRTMVAEQAAAVRTTLDELAGDGLLLLPPDAWTESDRRFLESHFQNVVLPVLTPLAISDLDPPPLLTGLKIFVAARLACDAHDGDGTQTKSDVDVDPPANGDGQASPDATGAEAGEADSDAAADGEPAERLVAVAVPGQMSRFVAIPGTKAARLALLDDVIAANLPRLFSSCRVLGTAVFRVTRDGDVPVLGGRDEPGRDVGFDDAGDLLHVVEEAVRSRRRRAPVRLEVSASAETVLRNQLAAWLDVDDATIFEIDGMLDATALFEIAGRSSLNAPRMPEWQPQPPADLVGADDIWEAIQDHDVLLVHPYETFAPVVRLLDAAADDPDVLAIKQTLYRTSGDSPIVGALERAAQRGKEVTVLVELQARFDEARNVVWARRLEDAGCQVIYGIAGLKTHAKAMLIVRREGQRIRRYVHLATGNYNDKTAKLYSDIGLLTCDRDMAGDVAAFFNLLTGSSEVVGWSKLIIAPTDLRRRFLEMIDREIHASTPDRPGLIIAKCNSLQDIEICEALYRASQAGVQVKLNIRGICVLRPGVDGLSENIEVTSIIDRYLEHARIFYFRNGGHEEVYLSSADWMQRNLSKRLEIMFPVVDPRLRGRLVDMLRVYVTDNVKARRLLPDGRYEKVISAGERVRAQEHLYNEAVLAARAAEQRTRQFVPLKRPEE